MVHILISCACIWFSLTAIFVFLFSSPRPQRRNAQLPQYIRKLEYAKKYGMRDCLSHLANTIHPSRRWFLFFLCFNSLFTSCALSCAFLALGIYNVWCLSSMQAKMSWHMGIFVSRFIVIKCAYRLESQAYNFGALVFDANHISVTEMRGSQRRNFRFVIV